MREPGWIASIRRVMESLAPVEGGSRRLPRVACPKPWHVTPAISDGGPRRAGPVTWLVFGKHLSEGGLDFYHVRPFGSRQVIVSFEFGPDQWVSLAADLYRCRFARYRLYEWGGRFCGCAENPPAAQLEHARWGWETDDRNTRPLATQSDDDAARFPPPSPTISYPWATPALHPSAASDFDRCSATADPRYRGCWANGPPLG